MKQIRPISVPNCQGIFVNFTTPRQHSLKLPFGIAQAGKPSATRSTRAITRSAAGIRAMEIEFFCHPDDRRSGTSTGETFASPVQPSWESSRRSSGRASSRGRAAHIRSHTDIEYLFRFPMSHRVGGWPIAAIMTRQHAQHSGKNLSYFDDEAWERDKISSHPKKAQEAKSGPPYRFLPHVIEPSAAPIVSLCCCARPTRKIRFPMKKVRNRW